ncbi:RNA pseudouridine synthase [Sporanaerobium hydrogeniformans]|uniref:RNA pseudouridine synthase n=1 Tax=Sporanaerobium hydrogeniformans TaxID=3072179 RepID=A0AC61DD36_9FIRM|nr:RluA family pseudouridine synthase [Sporanaerobium hydrogeniformans]PHV71139.1 RNA pseudouridine synthase [Sporanaerobium hydrogeniformans]
MKEIISLIVEDKEGTRLDKYLSLELEDYTRSFLQKQIEGGQVTVNGHVQNTKYKVKLGETILVTIPEPVEVGICEENIPLDIVYEDEDLLIVNKPQDMVVHPAPGNYTGTLVNALMYHAKDQLSGINGEIRPGIVHRIDKDTSGLLMVAKNDKTHLALSEALKVHAITRKYHAVVHGTFKEEEGIVEAPLGRSTQDRKKMAVVAGGRPAKTHYRVLETYKEFSYVELTLFTGRTHQIRVHMKHIGHPLLGDPVYGPLKNKFGLTKQTLHAKVLGFVHPTQGYYREFNSELPKYFEQIIDKLRKS